MPEDFVILVSPSIMKGMVPSGLMREIFLGKYARREWQHLQLIGSPCSSSIQSGRNERAPSQ